MTKYQIWNKKDNIITPIGEVLTAEQWINRYPMAGIDGIDIIIGGGVINGSICMEYTQTIELYRKMGVDFSACTTKQECLDAIEYFEDNVSVNNGVSVEERTAAALEYIAMSSMNDVEGVQSVSFDIIKSNYDKGLWTAAMVATAVKKGVITKEQYTQITGLIYE